MSTMKVEFPRMLGLQQEMTSAFLELESTTTLKEFLQLSERVSHILDDAEAEKAQKVEKTAQNIFQKSQKEALERQKENFFEKAEEIEKRGVLRDLSLLKNIQEISGKVEALDLQFPLLPPEEITEEIQDLAEKLREVSQKESYNEELVDALILRALEKVRHLQFRMDFPIVEELSEHSYQSNFARMLNQCAEDLTEGRKDSFLLLSPIQQKEICRMAKGGSCGALAKAVGQYLRSLQSFAHIAENFLYEDAHKVVASFQRVDKETKKAIEGILFSKTGQLWEPLKKEFEEGKLEIGQLFAGAVMEHLSDQILG